MQTFPLTFGKILIEQKFNLRPNHGGPSDRLLISNPPYRTIEGTRVLLGYLPKRFPLKISRDSYWKEIFRPGIPLVFYFEKKDPNQVFVEVHSRYAPHCPLGNSSENTTSMTERTLFQFSRSGSNLELINIVRSRFEEIKEISVPKYVLNYITPVVKAAIQNPGFQTVT